MGRSYGVWLNEEQQAEKARAKGASASTTTTSTTSAEKENSEKLIEVVQAYSEILTLQLQPGKEKDVSYYLAKLQTMDPEARQQITSEMIEFLEGKLKQIHHNSQQ